MARSDAAELLDLAIDRAPKLRERGILKIAIEGLSFELAPADQPAGDDEDDKDEPELGVFEDPATYGRTRTIPGRNRKEG